jgi:hypothetical protein
MTKKTYYIEATVSLVSAIEYLEDAIPCFIECEPVEMNYMEVSIICRDEDIAFVEKVVAPLV